jgi:hypothetical protein
MTSPPTHDRSHREAQRETLREPTNLVFPSSTPSRPFFCVTLSDLRVTLPVPSVTHPAISEFAEASSREAVCEPPSVRLGRIDSLTQSCLEGTPLVRIRERR